MSMKKPTPRDFITATDAKDAKEQDGRELARLNCNIPVELHTALKLRAAKERTSIAKLVEAWILSWHRP
jgi:predicted HicB family RNase H-like nuclease